MTRAAAFAALLLATATAHAGDSPLLDQAQQAIDGVDYDAAKGLVDKAITAGALEPADLARAHMLAGEVAAALGDDATARDHFVRWLLLDPDAALPDGVSPKIAEPFAAAKEQAGTLGAMTIAVRVERSHGKVHVFLDARDPLNLIAGLRVRRDDGRAAQEQGTSVELPADDAEPVTLTVLVLDEHDDQIAVKTVTAEASATPTPATPHHGWPAIVRWPTWTALAVVGGGVGGYFAWQTSKDHEALDALNADSMNHTFDEATAIEDRGKGHALDADIGFGVGAGFAAIAVLTALLEPHAHAEVAPMAGGGVAGDVRIRF